MTNRIVVDTNVFIEGVFGEEISDSAIVLTSLDDLGVRLVFSQEAIGELMYIFKRHANTLNMNNEEITEVLLHITNFFQYGKSINTRYLAKKEIKKINDPDDQMFIYAAYASEVAYLITLDKKSGILDLKDTLFTCCTPTEYVRKYNLS